VLLERKRQQELQAKSKPADERNNNNTKQIFKMINNILIDRKEKEQ
jgi:hypothetical protein